jgi:signal transduction histidine kinase
VTFALTIAVFFCQIELPYLDSLSNDWRMRLAPTTSTSGNVVTVAIDPLTVESLERDPNAIDHIRLLQKLKLAKPRAIVYTIDPDGIVGTYEDLEQLAKISENLPVFVASKSLPIKGLENELKLAPPLDTLAVIPGPKTVDTTLFAKDNVTRRMILFFEGKMTLHPLLASMYNGITDIHRYRGTFDVYGSTQALIDFRPAQTYQQESFYDVVIDQVNLEDFHDKIVLIGRNSKSTSKDYIMTPYSREIVAMSQLEMHANMIDTLIQNSAPIQPPKWLDLLLTAIISILTVFVVLTLRPTKGILILVGTIAATAFVSYIIYAAFGVFIGLSHPLLAIFICYYFFIPYRLIIENRRSWEYIQRNRLLTQVEELKSNFLRMMSHDLKTPLARIHGMTDVVLTDHTPLSHSQKDAILTIRNSSEELSEFIGSILNLGRIESKEIKLQLSSKDINSLLKDVIKKMEFLAQKKNIEVITEFEPLFSIKVDQDLLQQVFSNLVENAIKYSPENSRILVSTEELNGQIVVQVADQGIGIPPEEQPNVFEKFFRSASVTNGKTKGTGLGLYLSHYFVRLHKGNISLESEHGRGSTFTVELPMDL